jgi:hypothetical protein
MHHELELLRANYFPEVSPQIEIGIRWNGQEMSQVYNDPLEFANVNVDLIQDQPTAIRYLVFYLIGLGYNETTMQAMVGKKLIVETTNVVQQNITLV